jgi:hypothetical protein
MTRLDTGILLLVSVLGGAPITALVPQADSLREALNLGRTHDQALYDAFNAGYRLTPSGIVDSVEVVTEFRRAVLIVREHANQGEYSFSAQDLTRAMAPHDGEITFIVQARLHPLHTFAGVPPYDMYVETGATTRPLAAKPFKRDPVYPPGAAPGRASPLVGVRLEGSFPREGIDAASAPMLVVTDEKANVLWKTRIDLTRYR